MKFVIFNLIVVVSLGYLIMGNQPGLLQSLKDSIHSSKFNAATQKNEKSIINKSPEYTKPRAIEVTKPTQHSNPTKLETVNEVSPKVKAASKKGKSKTNTSQSAAEKPKFNISAQRLSAKKEIATRKTKPIQVNERKVNKPQHFDKSPKAVSVNSTEGKPTKKNKAEEEKQHAKFMTAKERRRELARLARDMELIFVNKLN